MWAFVKRFLRQLRQSGSHVELESIWRLSDDLQGLLQNTQWEGVSRLRSEPEPEVFVGLAHGFQEFFAMILEPSGQQMTVLQHEPVTSVGRGRKINVGFFLHTLTQ